MPLEHYVVGAAILVGALPVGGKLGFQELAEVLPEGGFFRCEGELHGYFEGIVIIYDRLLLSRSKMPLTRICMMAIVILVSHA